MKLFDWFNIKLNKNTEIKKSITPLSLKANLKKNMPINLEYEEISVIPEICNTKDCYQIINVYTRFNCQHCGNHHCEKHRLAENHDCKNPMLPDYMKKSHEDYNVDNEFKDSMVFMKE